MYGPGRIRTDNQGIMSPLCYAFLLVFLACLGKKGATENKFTQIITQEGNHHVCYLPNELGVGIF